MSLSLPLTYIASKWIIESCEEMDFIESSVDFQSIKISSVIIMN